MKIEQRDHWTLATLCVFGSVVLAAEVPQQEAKGTQDMKNAWVEKHLTYAKSDLPFSFTYDGQPSARLLAELPAKVENQRLDANRARRTLIWTDPKSGFEVRWVAVEYDDFPAIEWTVWFKNTGTKR